MNKKIITGILLIIMIIPLCSSPASADEVIIDGGYMEVAGTPDDPYTSAAAKRDAKIHVGRSGATVTIRVSYVINCPGDADDGYCHLEFIDGSDSESVWSGDSDSGFLEIQKFVYPRRVISWKLTAKYYDWWKTVLLSEDSDTGGGVTTSNPILNVENMEERIIASGTLTILPE
jgi:hypothetical protein